MPTASELTESLAASPGADADRLAALATMKRLATWLLVLMAVIFAVSFVLQERYPALQFVRAASEGGMVGALADWFAVSALFRYPMGLRIPHTNIIANRKNEIGASLGEFVEENFLSDQVVQQKLTSIGIADRVGAWLSQPENAGRLTDEFVVAAGGALELLDDEDVKGLIETLAREHLAKPEWGPSIGRVGERLVASGQQRAAVDLLLDRAYLWLAEHPEAFETAVSERLPGWLPRFVDRMVDDKAYREVLGFVAGARADRRHPLRLAVDRYLAELSHDLQYDAETIQRAEELKLGLLDSPRLREFTSETWDAVKVALGEALADPASPLRAGIRSTFGEIGGRLVRDRALGEKIDGWVAESVGYAVRQYRHEIASVITETVERWDAAETAEKIELQVGKDLQFIRINGTVVGALAGLAIFVIAEGLLVLF